MRRLAALVGIGAVYGLISLIGSVSLGALVLSLRGQEAFPSTEILRTLVLSLVILGIWALIGLGVGILIDATIVRALIVPALVALLGEWNWWLPAWLAGPLRVEPSPRRREPVDVPGQRTAEQRQPVA